MLTWFDKWLIKKNGLKVNSALQAAADELAPALATLFQLSLDLGEIPEDWREAWNPRGACRGG